MNINHTEELPSSIKKRFVKDFKLPINVFDEPYFSYFIDLYDSEFNTKSKIDLLYKSLQSCETFDDFFLKGNSILSNAKALIQNSKAYQEFNNCDMKMFEQKVKISQQNIYIDNNVGKKLFSIDLSKANFNSFKLFGLQDEIKCPTYEDLIGKFTQEQYFIDSKHIRQILFGDLNPARQQKIQRYIISNLCEKLLEHKLNLSSASSDEIIIDSPTSIEQIKKILETTDEKMKFFRVEEFTFTRIDPEHDFFIKKTISEKGELKTEFKNSPAFLFPQIFKKHNNLTINDYDLLFFHEGFLAQFKETLFPKDSLQEKIKPKLKH